MRTSWRLAALLTFASSWAEMSAGPDDQVCFWIGFYEPGNYLRLSSCPDCITLTVEPSLSTSRSHSGTRPTSVCPRLDRRAFAERQNCQVQEVGKYMHATVVPPHVLLLSPSQWATQRPEPTKVDLERTKPRSPEAAWSPRSEGSDWNHPYKLCTL